MSPVPVNSMGGTLKAKMYATPITVPGIANDSSVRNSNARWPLNVVRAIRYADKMPTMAVSGAAASENCKVLNSECQAAPVNRKP